MTIATPHVNTGASGNLETAAPHGAQAPAGRRTLSRRHLYMSAAALALLVAAGPAGVRPAEAAGIKSTTPTNLNITDIGTLLNNRSRSASGGDVVTTGSDSVGVDVQVKLQLGQQIPFVGWVNLGSPFDSVGDIDIDVGDVDAQYPGQKGGSTQAQRLASGKHHDGLRRSLGSRQHVVPDDWSGNFYGSECFNPKISPLRLQALFLLLYADA